MRLALLGLLLSACGGGEVVTPPVIQPVLVLDGLAGTVHMRDADLGRIVEQEPNDTRASAYRLAPTWSRCTFEVTGELGTTDEQYGRIDAVDAFRFVSLEAQAVTLDVTFTALDPVGGQPNALALAVVDSDGGFPVVSEPATSGPLSVEFDAEAEKSYDVTLTIASGHAAYVMRVETRDPAGPQPITRRAPAPPMATDPAHGRVATSTAGAPGEPTCAATHLLVRLRDGCDASSFCARTGLSLGRRLGTGSYCMGFDVAAGASGRRKAVALAGALAADPDVTWAEPDWIVTAQSVPDDPEFNRQWNLRAIGAPPAWDVTIGEADVVVAVVDTGIVAHPDLQGQTVAGYDFISDPRISLDGDGRDDDPTDPGDRFLPSGLSSWHGTHVAGIVAARQDDQFGISGVAPGCRVMPLRVLGIGGGFVSDAVDAVLFGAGLFTTESGRRASPRVDVMNLSLGLTQDSSDLRDACTRASNTGVFLVASAGNNGSAGVLFPAAYGSVFAVAATDGANQTTYYSSAGPQVELSAPGGLSGTDAWNDGWTDGILSCVFDQTISPHRMTHWSAEGTSQAAPHVAGAAALLLSLDRSLRVTDLRAILRGTAMDLGPVGDDEAYGAGLLQVQRAVATVLKQLGTPRADPPSLYLPTTSVKFEGFDALARIPLYNGGGGLVVVTAATGDTDDGVPWLRGTLLPANEILPPVDKSHVQIEIDRHLLPPGAGRYSGSLRLFSGPDVLGTIRVNVFASELPRFGRPISVLAFDRSSMREEGEGLALAERNYRYLVREIPAADYLLQGGEDLDSDGLFCEVFEMCGWHGGPTQNDAVAVPFVPGGPLIRGLGITLEPVPGP